jgi:hypothetical protein
MERKKEPTLPPEVEAVRSQIESWRATRRLGSRMPEDLWVATLALTRRHHPGLIAKSFRLDYKRLRMRMDRGEGEQTAGEAHFIELPPAPSDGLGPVVEVQAQDGTRLVVRLPIHSRLDLPALIETFCRGVA